MREVVYYKNKDRIKNETGTTPVIDDYFTKILKLIPADIVAAWILISGMVVLTKTDPAINYGSLIWICFFALLAIVPLYLFRVTNVKGIPQILITMGAFVVWVFALGVPFSDLNPDNFPYFTYQSIYGQLLLIFYTLVVPMILPSQQPPPNPPT
jgi:hypothetical protein